MTPHAIPPLLSKKEAAQALGISRSTLDRLRLRGELRATRIGGRVVFAEPDLLALLHRARESAAAPAIPDELEYR
jgi:excisionase family DNA binding protein